MLEQALAARRARAANLRQALKGAFGATRPTGEEVRKAAVILQCSKSFIYGYLRTACPRDPQLVISNTTHQIFVDEELYVSITWLARKSGLTRDAVWANLRRVKMPKVIRIRENAFGRETFFFPLQLVKEKFPAWEQRIEDMETPLHYYTPAVRETCKDVTDAEYTVLCELVQWWLRFQFWPTHADLLRHPRIRVYVQSASGLAKLIAALRTKGYLSTEHVDGDRVQRLRYVIHRGPKALISRSTHCPKCRHTHFDPQPFFQPKSG